MQDQELNNLISEVDEDLGALGKHEAFLLELKRIRTALERIADDIALYVEVKVG